MTPAESERDRGYRVLGGGLFLMSEVPLYYQQGLEHSTTTSLLAKRFCLSQLFEILEGVVVNLDREMERCEENEAETQREIEREREKDRRVARLVPHRGHPLRVLHSKVASFKGG